jgi:hypothetical protein
LRPTAQFTLITQEINKFINVSLPLTVIYLYMHVSENFETGNNGRTRRIIDIYKQNEITSIYRNPCTTKRPQRLYAN